MDEDITDKIILWFGTFLRLKNNMIKRSFLFFLSSSIFAFFLLILNIKDISWGNHAVVYLSDLVIVSISGSCLVIFIMLQLLSYYLQLSSDVFIKFIHPDKTYTIIKEEKENDLV